MFFLLTFIHVKTYLYIDAQFTIPELCPYQRGHVAIAYSLIRTVLDMSMVQIPIVSSSGLVLEGTLSFILPTYWLYPTVNLVWHG